MKLDPEIFEMAAERLFTEDSIGACGALSVFRYTPPTGSYEDHRDYLARWFKPRNRSKDLYWWGYNDREARVLGLLLCAELVREGWE